MKKVGALFIFAILFISFLSSVISEEMPDPTAGIKDSAGGILDEEGIHTENINTTISPYKSKAEERIDAINQWLENNASWFKTITGAVPEISWYFAFVIYFFLWGFVNLILNNRRNLYLRWGSRKLGGHNISLYIGAIGFIILFIALKVQILLTNITFYTWVWGNDKWYYVALKLVIIVGLTLLASYLLGWWGKNREEKSKKDAEEEQETNQEALKKTVEGITGQNS